MLEVQKLERVLMLGDQEWCIASRQKATIIDAINPETGRTVCYGKTLADCREEYPDAEMMTVEEFCSWKAEQQRTPITWEPTTAERFDELRNVLPPAAYRFGGFLVGEPTDHDAGNGLPRFDAYRQWGRNYYASSRPMTRPEFRAAIELPPKPSTPTE